MSRQEAVEQYKYARKLGEKYYKSKTAAGADPYPLVLNSMIKEADISGRVSLGVMNIPSELIVGTEDAGRIAALAGNFMPILADNSEFATKWINLCEAHLSDEGIRDPIKCLEYLGRFYVQEGNKRVSVLRSFDSPMISAQVTRVVPVYSDEPEIQSYYAFMRYFQLSGLYQIHFQSPDSYSVLQHALGFTADHVWSQDEKRSFIAAFSHFTDAYDRFRGQNTELPAIDAFLSWLRVFPISKLKEFSNDELLRSFTIMSDAADDAPDDQNIEINTAPSERDKSVLSKILNVARPDHLNVAFIYAFPPEKSIWTRAHLHGQKYLETVMGSKLSIKAYNAYDRDYDTAMQQAAADKAQLIFATTAQMIPACRRIAAIHPDIRVLNCSLSLPYKEIRTYYSRIYESKYIAGAIAGAMADQDRIGYIASYPIVGVPAEINAFALGARFTNPRARIKLMWSCVDRDPLAALVSEGIMVISNRDAATPAGYPRNLEWGTYKFSDDGSFLPLAVPCWDWGRLYVKIVESIFNGTWNQAGSKNAEKAINYWWGLDSGVIDIQLSEEMPSGTMRMAELLKHDIASGNLAPFSGDIIDQEGTKRCTAGQTLGADDLMMMDWLCDNVEGCLPNYEELLPESRETVRILGIKRADLPQEELDK